MKRRLALALVTALATLAASACSSTHDESWIGKNVGVTVDSEAQPPAPGR